MGGIPKATDMQRALKKFIHENAVTLVAAGLFLLVLSVLILSRFGALHSIRDIADINPLITKNNTELIAVNVNGIVKIAKDDDWTTMESDKQTEKSSDKTSNPTATKPGTSAVNSPGGATGGGAANGGGGGNTNGGGAPKNTPTPSTTPLKASVISIKRTSENPENIRGSVTGITCTRKYNFTAQVEAASGSGTITLKWGFNGGDPKDPVTITFSQKSQVQTVSYSITRTGRVHEYSIETYLTDVFQKDETFIHTCIL